MELHWTKYMRTRQSKDKNYAEYVRRIFKERFVPTESGQVPVFL